MKKYIVTLTDEERRHLEQLLGQGKAAAPTLQHAYGRLKADEVPGGADEPIAAAFLVSVRTVERLRQRFVEEGREAALHPRLPRKVDGEVQAYLIALACCDPPQGRKRWTVRLLSDRRVELGYLAAIASETVRQVLRKRIEAMATEVLADTALSLR